MKATTIEIEITTDEGEVKSVPITGFLSDKFPGMIVCKNDTRSADYYITHLKSGRLVVNHFPKKDLAITCATEFAAKCNFDVSWDDLQKLLTEDNDLRRGLMAIARPLVNAA